jgi:hypothetical protein
MVWFFSSDRRRGAEYATVIVFTAHHLDGPVRGREGRNAVPVKVKALREEVRR